MPVNPFCAAFTGRERDIFAGMEFSELLRSSRGSSGDPSIRSQSSNGRAHNCVTWGALLCQRVLGFPRIAVTTRNPGQQQEECVPT